MPGAYAHMTLVNLAKEPARLESVQNFPYEAISAVLEYLRFTELGAVSPDYPYLVIGDGKAVKWADAMHYTNTGAMIQAGVEILKNMGGEKRRKGLAWLLGYTAHVTMDVTIHPIIEKKVGPYAENKGAHRKCEMHQDAYIFQRLNLGEVGLSEHLDSGLARCGDQGDKYTLDADIVDLWDKLLQKNQQENYKLNKPNIRKWHKCFIQVVDKIAEEGNLLLPLSRHVAVDSGLTYPSVENIDKEEYIDKLQTPHNTSLMETMSYDQIFDLALKNVVDVWALVASGVFSANSLYLTKIGPWDLDTGRNNQDGKLVFWS